MKRKVFEIKRNGLIIKTKSAWNASIRFIEDDVRELAKIGHTTFVLGESESKRGGSGFHETGRRVWYNKDQFITYEIELTAF